MSERLDREQYAATVRQAAAEGIVLLENNHETLPFRAGGVISVFGRTQFDYNKSGTGSGGMVHAPYVIGIYDALCRSQHVTVNEELAEVYRVWRKKNPAKKGSAGPASRTFRRKCR